MGEMLLSDWLIMQITCQSMQVIFAEIVCCTVLTSTEQNCSLWLFAYFDIVPRWGAFAFVR